MFSSRTVVFPKITRKREVKIPCKVCGKKSKRVLSVTNTVNPFNLNKDGQIKSQQEVTDNVVAQLKAKVEETLAVGRICTSCELDCYETA